MTDKWIDGVKFEGATVRKWWNRGQNTLPLVDIREEEEYNRQHLSPTACATKMTTISTTNDTGIETLSPPIVVVNLPFLTLLSGMRSPELPPRSTEFAVLAPSTIVTNIDERNKFRLFFYGTTSKATAASRKPWSVRQILFDSCELWNEARDMNLLVGENQPMSREWLVARSRLWQPNKLVLESVWPLLRDILDQYPTKTNHSPKLQASPSMISTDSCNQVWDLGSGAGRDVCYLAEQSLAYFNKESSSGDTDPETCGEYVKETFFPLKFVGIDLHPQSSLRCIPFWERRGIGEITESKRLDLSKIDEVQQHLCLPSTMQNEHVSSLSSSMGDSSVICIYAIRFLNRKLFEYLVHSPLCSGTIFAICHFCKSHNGADWPFDHPKEQNVLEREELGQLFAQTDTWDVVRDEIVMSDGDFGRTMVEFVALKK